jgi:hypothetical protein
MFASHWNGAGIIVHDDSPEFNLTSDASGAWGCGAWHGNQWFQIAWNSSTASLNIAAKELIPIIVASAVWGLVWKGGRVLAHCDNAAVVEVVNRRSCRDPNLMQMLRCLFFFEAHYQFELSARHIAGIENGLADDLSRNNLASFRAKSTNWDHEPTFIPPPLLQGLLDPGLDWTSPTWMELFNSSVQRV